MRLLKALIIIVALAILLGAASEVRSQNANVITGVVASAISSAQAKSLNTKSVKWDSVRSIVMDMAKDAKSIPDLKRSLDALLVCLDDPFSRVYMHDSKTVLAGFQQPAFDGGDFSFAILENDIRYIRVGSAPAGKSEIEYSQLIRDAVDSLMKGDAHQWIIDLRYSVGEDANPLLAGLAPIFDEGLFASNIGNDKKIGDMYTIHNGNFYLNQVQVGKFTPHAKEMSHAKIAVLTSGQTRGAAEIVALGIRAMKKSRFFGEPTVGDVCKKTIIDISNGVRMDIAESYFVDKRGIAHRGPLRPNELISFVKGQTISDDEAIAAASRWLNDAPVIDNKEAMLARGNQ